jgi:hypothetical protein
MQQFPKEYKVEVLPVVEAMKLDRFLGISEVDDAAPAVDQLEVTDSRSRTFVVSRDEDAKKKSKLDQVPLLTIAPNGKGIETKPLELVGVMCREHPDRRLSPQVQTDVWPFIYAPRCCVVVNGVRCDSSSGVVYSCQHSESTADGTMCMCDFAICERHYRGGVVDGIYADVLAVVRTAQQRGNQWIVATIVMLVANAAYMPFVKTAIMILACHPMYQCEFTECHNFSDQKYLIAFYLSMCVVALFGFGLPLIQVLQLRRRRGLLFHIFFADEYHGRYEEADETDTMSERNVVSREIVESGDVGNKLPHRTVGGTEAVEQMAAPQFGLADEVEGSSHRPSEGMHVHVPGAQQEETTVVAIDEELAHVHTNESEQFHHDEASLIDDDTTYHHSKVVIMGEWNRFLTSDPTVLGTLYKSLEFNWIYLSPLILLWKVVLICPAVFLPAGTFNQHLGICATEVGFALFMYTTAPFISPMVDLMYRVGSIHQILFLGLRSLDTLARYRDEKAYGNALVALTFAYLSFSVGCIISTTVGPQIRKAWDKNRSTKALEELGFQYTLTTTLYVVPTPDGVSSVERTD